MIKKKTLILKERKSSLNLDKLECKYDNKKKTIPKINSI